MSVADGRARFAERRTKAPVQDAPEAVKPRTLADVWPEDQVISDEDAKRFFGFVEPEEPAGAEPEIPPGTVAAGRAIFAAKHGRRPTPPEAA